MERQPHSFDSRDRESSIQRRKAYVTPDLREWGSIRDLTQGGKIGFEDIPKGGVGGTRPV